ncbi:PIN domain-containing protein [Deinococcus ruber]|uniref:Ribonuclease VapC n=1 Tax=Deinococcus ruber TaxID=1848197 RepID=A0A918FJ32_9DEIO|nr:PIN domain-containing protein [Deinococcus ruber]GGR41790.1 twitching motility protein PilT [Deinococcus ruber]
MRYLLDTNTVSDFFRKHPTVLARLRQVPPGDLAISSVTVMEIEYGMERQPSARKKFGQIWEDFQSDVHVLTYNTQDAVHTGRVRAHLARLGTPIGPFDLQLAGTALARRLTVVTNNTDEFSRVPEVTLEDWR